MNLQSFAQVAGWIASIILGFLWLDSRHDAAGASETAEVNAILYGIERDIADIDGRITMYNAKEEFGQITAADRSRREVLRTERAELDAEKDRQLQRLQTL